MLTVITGLFSLPLLLYILFFYYLCNIWLCCAVLSCSVVSDSATPWTVAHQAPLSMEFSRQEYWSGLPFPTLGELPGPGIRPEFLAPHELVGGFLPTVPPGKPYLIFNGFAGIWPKTYMTLKMMNDCSFLSTSTPLLFESSLYANLLYATSLLWKTYISTIFH